MRALTRLFALPLLLLAAACAGVAADPPAAGSRGSRDALRLSQQEIQDTHAGDAYEAVRQLRPHWLRKRGQMSLHGDGEIMVYVDNVRYGSVESLRGLPLLTIGSMQFLDAPSATQRWGTNHVHGAILVQTR